MPHQSVPPAQGLRERKRLATRQRIADAATQQFMTRGFDAVTIAQIAELADVSKVTVFNYFPRKEDLLFDRLPEAHTLLSEAVTTRATGQTPLAAVRDLLTDLARRGHPFAAAGDGFDRFFRVVMDSPTLVARAREAADELEDYLTQLFQAAGGPLATEGEPSPSDTADPRLAAALLVATYRVIYRETARRQMAGEPPATLLQDHEDRILASFARLERALAPTQPPLARD